MLCLHTVFKSQYPEHDYVESKYFIENYLELCNDSLTITVQLAIETIRTSSIIDTSTWTCIQV